MVTSGTFGKIVHPKAIHKLSMDILQITLRMAIRWKLAIHRIACATWVVCVFIHFNEISCGFSFSIEQQYSNDGGATAHQQMIKIRISFILLFYCLVLL